MNQYIRKANTVTAIQFTEKTVFQLIEQLVLWNKSFTYNQQGKFLAVDITTNHPFTMRLNDWVVTDDGKLLDLYRPYDFEQEFELKEK